MTTDTLRSIPVAHVEAGTRLYNLRGVIIRAIEELDEIEEIAPVSARVNASAAREQLFEVLKNLRKGEDRCR